MEMLTLMTWLVLADPRLTVSEVPCETVKQLAAAPRR